MKNDGLLRSAILFCILAMWNTAFSQTDYTDSISNPSFETGNASGWTWNGTTGYAWAGVNTDGDNTKTGNYIIGTWNAVIGDVELSQTIQNLPNGMYTVTADLMGSSNATTSRLTTQRLFANGVSMLFGVESAYSAENLSMLEKLESYTFGGYSETANDAGPFKTLTVVAPVSDGTLKFGIHSNGKGSTLGFSFPNLTAGDGHGWFKADNFTLTRTGDLNQEVTSNAGLRNITVPDAKLTPAFQPETTSYTVLLPVGSTTVQPQANPIIPGVMIQGVEAVDVSSGEGISNITVTAVDGNTTKTYTIAYEVEGAFVVNGNQQDKLYTNEFPLGDVTLLDGPFKHAAELNIQTLLQYDVDRLLAPYRKEAGLPAKAVSYPNWDGLDGHIGGHYLSAMAIHFAATRDTACERLMNYMVSELQACQQANGNTYPTWGVGYVGGVPASPDIWPAFKSGNFSAFNDAWVAWYNLHKTYAGLRDAWLYGNSKTAKQVFLLFCDWAVEITTGLTDAQMENMLGVEHGGMNEVLADAFQITADAKYLTAAKRFSHKQILNSMSAESDNLDNMHANTQVPKAVGFQRIAEVSGDARYEKAAQFFWETVVEKRSLSLGGNSRKEYFPQASASIDYINSVEGPESCNTNNMLKLTEHLFREHPEAKYADYFERALLNHILSTQHPEHGGYVYFTPARPQHYRVYSAPNQAMWCCVGTGMENHGKYGEFIYTHSSDTLYVNLFMASELNWKAKNITVLQETQFPEEETTQLRITCDAPTTFSLKVRSPKWVAEGALQVFINGEPLTILSTPQTYITIERTWNNGDSVRIELPMQNTIETLPNVSRYVAFMHGPLLLSAKTGTNDLTGLIADDSRWGHIANGKLMPLWDAPLLLEERDQLSSKINKIEGENLKFKLENIYLNPSDTSLVLEPFYKIHDARYMMYWLNLNEDQYQQVVDSLADIEKAKLELETRTIDKVAPGEQQPEADHNYEGLNSYSGNHQNEFWRDARDGGYISYTFDTHNKSDLSLMARYWGNESGNRTFDILIDGEKLVTENIVGKWNLNDFVNVEYLIPNTLIDGKDEITVKFQAIDASNLAGGLFYVRLLQALQPTKAENIMKAGNHWRAFGSAGKIVAEALPESGSLSIYNLNGELLSQSKITDSTMVVQVSQPGVYIVVLDYKGVRSAQKIKINPIE